jgi:hypothetical protein
MDSFLQLVTSDRYTWIGGSGGLWGSALNWRDNTSGADPALSVPGSNTAVSISGPTGSTYEVISGGGAAASLTVTGYVSLDGRYALGSVALGAVPTTPSSGSVNAGLNVSPGATVSVGAVAVDSAAISVSGAGAALTASGPIRLGASSGYLSSPSSLYTQILGTTGNLSVSAGAQLVASGEVNVASGTLSVDGSGTNATLGTLTLGVSSSPPNLPGTPIQYGTFYFLITHLAQPA